MSASIDLGNVDWDPNLPRTTRYLCIVCGEDTARQRDTCSTAVSAKRLDTVLNSVGTLVLGFISCSVPPTSAWLIRQTVLIDVP
jgi:hypothetical protein